MSKEPTDAVLVPPASSHANAKHVNMSSSFSFGFLVDDECQRKAEVVDQREPTKVSANREQSSSSSTHDVGPLASPFTFRSVLDVNLALSALALKDLHVEYVRFPDTSIEPLLQIQLLQDDVKLPLTLDHNAVDGSLCSQPLPEHVDIIPGVYEGGAKVWECSLDLLQYMASEKHELLQKNKVLEIGCGHALPSCWWLRERMSLIADSPGNEQVDLDFSILCSDYNDFVIDNIVLSNISANTRGYHPSQVAQHLAVGAGDWMEMSQQLLNYAKQTGSETYKQWQHQLPSDGKFDLILAAETTYTEKAAHDTVELMRRHLKINSGIGLVATKRYYFGVGGGALAFRQYSLEPQSSDVSNSDAELIITTLQVYDNGVGNIRELLKVQCISPAII